MRATVVTLGALLVLGPAAGRAQEKPAADKPAAVTPQAAGSDLNVSVTYTGKGTVDDTHELWVFLFPTPEIGPQSEPIASLSVKKNGGVAAFKSITQPVVYIAVVFDEKANYDGTSAPPQGTPVAVHVKDGAPVGVKPGTGAKVKVSFDDSVRMTHQ
jgi:hypothetical protein